MCGDASIIAAQAAQQAGTVYQWICECGGCILTPLILHGAQTMLTGAERFVFISNSRVGSYVPTWAPLYGYYHGKERAEAAVVARY